MNLLSRLRQTPDNSLIVYADKLTKRFGQEVGVEELHIEIAPGTILGLIGPSGSGKTTAVRLLSGIYRPTSGEVRVFGMHPSKFSQSTRERLGYMPQLFVLYPDLTVLENLNFAASIYGMGNERKKQMREVLEFVDLTEHTHKLARDISGGMQRRLSLAATLVHDPELIFLDEPTAGIDPILRSKFWEHFARLKQEGRTLFITTQYVGEAAYCDFVGVMVKGHLLEVLPPDKLRERAFGGEVVDITTPIILEDRFLNQLCSLPFVMNQKVARLPGNKVRLIVDEASTAMPMLLEWTKGQGVTVEGMEEYLPPYDDVFVEIVRQAEAQLKLQEEASK